MNFAYTTFNFTCSIIQILTCRWLHVYYSALDTQWHHLSQNHHFSISIFLGQIRWLGYGFLSKYYVLLRNITSNPIIASKPHPAQAQIKVRTYTFIIVKGPILGIFFVMLFWLISFAVH